MRSLETGPAVVGEYCTLTLQGMSDDGMLGIALHPLSSITKSLFVDVTSTVITKFVMPPERKS
ncbi:hypothetical protein GCM10007052_07300 [Halioglobus japonicus]|nr:hypothetical protein GCM10007052_07300 [Halioglobus japonicus]